MWTFELTFFILMRTYFFLRFILFLKNRNEIKQLFTKISNGVILHRQYIISNFVIGFQLFHNVSLSVLKMRATFI